ncbi:hypothetical protein FBU59_005538, partial [Linderina macrospora]
MDLPRPTGLSVPTFTGSPQEDVNDFIRGIKDYFLINRTDSDLCPLILGNQLKKAARKWYLAMYPTNGTPAEVILEALRTRFTNEVRKNQLRDELAKLTQKKSVEEYANSFQDLVNRIGDPSTASQTRQFVRGLKENIRGQVALTRPVTLNAAIENSAWAESTDKTLKTPNPMSTAPRKILQQITPTPAMPCTSVPCPVNPNPAMPRISVPHPETLNPIPAIPCISVPCPVNPNPAMPRTSVPRPETLNQTPATPRTSVPRPETLNQTPVTLRTSVPRPETLNQTPVTLRTSVPRPETLNQTLSP